MTVVYKPEKEMLVADCLSRAQLLECDEDTDLTGIMHSVTQSACLSKENYELYRSIIERDEIFHEFVDMWRTAGQISSTARYEL